VLENNKFELVFDELVDFKAMKNILKNNNAVTEIFDIEEMEEEEDDE
jgi:tubulin monoglycylase TTLL3/8